MKKRPIEMRNPFIVTPGEFWANRESLWKRIIDRIELARHTRSNEIIVFTGTYGCGTTHTLKYLKKDLDQKGAVATYITTSFQSTFQSLYQKFFQQISSDKREKIIENIVSDLVEIPLEMSPEQMDSVEQAIPTLKAIISGEQIRTLSLKDRQRRRTLGKIVRIPTGLELWSRVIMELATETWPVFILLDEFDAALMGLSIELIFNLRRLYDETLTGLCIIVGLKGEPEEAKQKLGGALYSRMTFQPIHLHPLSKAEGQEFLKAILEFAHSRSKKRQPSPYFPFTEKSIKTLIELTCPTTPRRLLRVSSLIFEQARLERLSIIGEDFVFKIAMKFGKVSVKMPTKKAEPPKVAEKREKISEVTPQELRGIIEFGRDGIPNLLIDPVKLTAREVIGLILYAKAPNPIDLRELTILVTRSWRNVGNRYIAANLAQMRKLIIREGKKRSYKYTLSGIGKSWIKNELIPKLRSGARKEA